MIKQIFEVKPVPCVGEFRSRNRKLDYIAKSMFGNKRYLLFSKSRKDEIPIMKKKFIRHALNNFTNITQQQVAEYLGYNDHSGVNHHLHND